MTETTDWSWRWLGKPGSSRRTSAFSHHALYSATNLSEDSHLRYAWTAALTWNADLSASVAPRRSSAAGLVHRAFV